MGADTEILNPVPGTDDWKPWLAWLDAALHVEVVRLRARYELNLDEFRGLYIGDEQVNRLLRRQTPPIDLSAEEGRQAYLLREACQPALGPLRRTAETFDLPELDVAALVVAFAPEIDPKYSTLYAYLNDDVSRKHPTIDLIVRLTGHTIDHVQPASTLFADRLLLAQRYEGQSWRSTAVYVSEPLREFLTGAESRNPTSRPNADLPEPLLDADLRLIVLEEPPGANAFHSAKAIAGARGLGLRTVTENWQSDLLRAGLQDEALYLPSDTFKLDRGPLGLLLEAPILKLLAVGDRIPWREWLESEDYETYRVEPLDAQGALPRWREALAQQGLQIEAEDLERITGLFALHPHQIENASKALRRRRTHDFATLAEVCRNQTATDLGVLATRETTEHGWSGLILPPLTHQLLRGFASAVRDRSKVFDTWGFAVNSGGRRSLLALFAGSSGTGKTLSASVVAKELGLDLYRIDLSSVISKYIGETEQNLERIFRAAESGNAILFFDEADALFGKRSEVKDAHDRFSNIEIAYLLQRMEAYDGILILATNLSKNMDEAFARRIHFEIEFPMPDEADRLRLWELHLPQEAPRHDDIDLRFLAAQFTIAGGDIRNVALQAAFLAADDGGPIAMRHLIHAMARQRTKQGKLPSASQFKQYFEWT